MAEQQYHEQAAPTPTTAAETAAQAQLNMSASGRPRVLRTHSSPVATAKYAGGQQQQSSLSRPSTPLADAASSSLSHARGLGIDTDEQAGSPRRLATNGFLQTNNDSEYEVNIAVVGSIGVGKSTFIQQSLGLANRPTAAVNARRISVDSATYLVRMLECRLEDVHVDKENRITWPLDPRMPSVDAACTLYDISNKDTFEDVPVVLNALEKSSVPSVLVSNKCDIDKTYRQLDPNNIEQRAKAILRSLDTLQSSISHVDSHAKGIASLLQAVSGKSHPPPPCSSSPGVAPMQTQTSLRDPASSRRRTISSALAFSQASRSHSRQGHVRASSAQSNTMRKDSRHDSTTMVTTPSTSTNPPLDIDTNLDESRDDITDSSRSEHASSSEDGGLDVDSQSEAPSDERGYSFDNLVDRLLRLPRSKADTRFGSVFLALYRKFAAPGQLLEAIVHRFEALEKENCPFMTKTVSQLRYLSVIEQWIGTYPGDFAHTKTRRRMRIFVAKLSNTRIFSAAAREMSCDLDVVTEDDDTNWACCDLDREKRGLLSPDLGWSSRVSTLLDDPEFDFSDNLGSLSLDGGQGRNAAHSLHTDFGMLQTVDAARRQGPSLVPVPKIPISKMHWHMLMETPTDHIACELTRIDWIMFSALMHVARKLREMNNYNSLGAFLAGISSAAVHRLAATRELVSPETGKDWMKLEILMSPTRSYSAYRLAWENSSGERIPFLPLPIRDLVAAEEGNKTFVGDEVNGRINWRKFEVMGETVVGIQKAQGLPYRNSMLGPRNDELRALILNSNMIRDDEALYDRSCSLESTNDRRGLRDIFRRA
ncbi:ras GEF [Aureobasidium pullulans]|uniref:Ras GEF n=1 Tax=Aureobasidium pullulans TaxID=5580 RepID=A0A4S9AGZ8_AURPU|nr:ras GEF [Aureobasidium pullulans]